MTSLFARATRSVGKSHIQYVTPVGRSQATGLVARVYRDMERDFGMLAPPLTLHAAAPAALAGAWLMLRETLLVPGAVGRAAKETVAAAVSLSNRCPYCVDVHGTTLAGLLRGPDAAAVAADRIDAMADPALRALARWARASALGAPPGPPEAAITPAQAPELIGVAVTFHYINRMVNVFLCESPLPPVPATLLGPVRRVAARVLAGLARIVPDPGGHGDVLPAAPLSGAPAWAAGRPAIAEAFARAGAAIDAGATRWLPGPVAELVTAQLDGGAADPGLGSGAWLDDVTAGLPPQDVPAARLALLTALASYQVTPTLVGRFTAQGHGEAALIELASWASLAAARRIGERLHESTRRAPDGG